MPEIIFSETYMKIKRLPNDPKFYGVGNAKGESNFLYFLKNILNKEYGYDLIKKRMWRDGHMVDDMQQYLRTRSPKSKGAKVAIYNPNWAVEGAEERWNEGEVTLAVMQNIFEED